jgi:hypothetical protein
MTATAAQIAQLRRMVAEPTTTTYSDAALQGYIEAYPLMDERGEQPYTFDSATPPAKVVNPSWVATYDLHAAAADIWEEKAALWAGQHDFSAAGSSFARSQVYEQMTASARYHRSRRAPKTMHGFKEPKERGRNLGWIANLPEED